VLSFTPMLGDLRNVKIRKAQQMRAILFAMGMAIGIVGFVECAQADVRQVCKAVVKKHCGNVDGRTLCWQETVQVCTNVSSGSGGSGGRVLR